MVPIGRRGLVALTVIWALSATGAAVFLASGRHDLGRAIAQPSPGPIYVGAETCAACYTKQQADWQGSHHDLAMQHATEETVLVVPA